MTHYPSDIKLPALIEHFLHQAPNHYSQPTISAYSQALQMFLKHLRDHHKIKPTIIMPAEIDAGWGETFLQWLQETRSVETEHLYIRALYQFLSFASKYTPHLQDLSSLAAYIEHNRRPKMHTLPTIPQDAIEAIVKCAEASSGQSGAASERELLGQLRDRAFILVLTHSGLRISEICDLRKSQADLLNAQLFIDEQIAFPLPASAAGAIKSYLNARQNLDSQQPISNREHLPLFARHDKRAGSRILPISRWTGANIVESWVHAALTPEERLKLEDTHQTITPHTFRHYFVINALMSSDQDIGKAQSLARHGDRSTTRRYLQKIEQAAE